MTIKIDYDGEYPCLCMGHLIVTIGDVVYDFGRSALSSGGGICRDDEWNMWAEEGDWDIHDEDWPIDFPSEYKQLVIDKINEEIPHGCCGGCI